jgi:hypothetical protein
MSESVPAELVTKRSCTRTSKLTMSSCASQDLKAAVYPMWFWRILATQTQPHKPSLVLDVFISCRLSAGS